MGLRKNFRPTVKPLAKVMNGGVKETGKRNRLVAQRNIVKMEKEGWKKVSEPKDKHNRVLNINTNTDDLVLMEK